MKEFFEDAVDHACASALRCVCVIACSLVLGFLAGYWIGHGKITSPEQTLFAFFKLPVIWIWWSHAAFAQLITALALYLLVYYESRRVRIAAAVTTFLTWFIFVYIIVNMYKNQKFVLVEF